MTWRREPLRAQARMAIGTVDRSNDDVGSLDPVERLDGCIAATSGGPAVPRDAGALVAGYDRLSGKPLGVTREGAELEPAGKLGLTLRAARSPGHDTPEKIARTERRSLALTQPKNIARRAGPGRSGR